MYVTTYLRNRYQRVEIKNKNISPNAFSNWGVTKHSIPQGSILGPLLFLLYINHLSKIINKNLNQFNLQIILVKYLPTLNLKTLKMT
jgi:hypothetical protein